jgi:hypothetical protein
MKAIVLCVGVTIALCLAAPLAARALGIGKPGRYAHVRQAERTAILPTMRFFQERISAATTPEQLDQAISLTNQVVAGTAGSAGRLVVNPEGTVSLAGTHLEGLELANQYATALYQRQRQLIDLLNQVRPLAEQAGMEPQDYLRSIGAEDAATAVNNLYTARRNIEALDAEMRSRAYGEFDLRYLQAARAIDPARYERYWGPGSPATWPVPPGRDPYWWSRLSPEQREAELQYQPPQY